ncbi:MAG: hypothetical protein JWR50_203 [Mucilaginibacter sp.]|nr:hypothetical protein [Mucilaginibacter sp.]
MLPQGLRWKTLRGRKTTVCVLTNSLVIVVCEDTDDEFELLF